MTPTEIIEHLDLQPHPEGGHYRRVYENKGRAGRPMMTSIYYLLRRGEISRWHRLDADEVWHHYSGAPLQLTIAAPNQPPHEQVLGTDLWASQTPQLCVPAGHWQTAQSLGEFSLVGATVSPGFTFDGFELAPAGFKPTTSR